MAYYRALDISVGDNDLAHFKYIKRWKEGNEWRYKYPDDNSGRSTSASSTAQTNRNFGVKEAMNYAHAKRQANNYRNSYSKATTKYQDAYKAKESAISDVYGGGLKGLADRGKKAIDATKAYNVASKEKQTVSSAYDQAKKIEENAKKNFENTTLGQASKQISAGLDWIKKTFKDSADCIKDAAWNFAEAAATIASIPVSAAMEKRAEKEARKNLNRSLPGRAIAKTIDTVADIAGVRSDPRYKDYYIPPKKKKRTVTINF